MQDLNYSIGHSYILSITDSLFIYIFLSSSFQIRISKWIGSDACSMSLFTVYLENILESSREPSRENDCVE